MIYPNNFQQLYQCSISHTGEKLYKVPQSVVPSQQLNSDFVMRHSSEYEIAIKMPESEYNRFVTNWNQYLAMVNLAKRNPEFKEQFQHLMALASILE